MPTNYAAQYARELANQYPYLSYFSDLWGQGEGERFRPLNGKTVYIPSMRTTGARAVNRDQITGVFNRNWNVDWQACDLAMYREWDTLVDPMDRVQTNDVATIANVTRTFNEQQKVPEMDAYAASKLAGFASSFGGIDTTTLTSANILDQWDSYLEYMTNHRVNRDRVRCKMIPGIYKLLKEATGLTRFVETAEGFRGVDRNIARLDGVRIEEVPADIMQSAFDFTVGWQKAAGAQAVNMIMYDPIAIAAPVVYETSMISESSAQSKGKELYYEAYYYDLFALMERQGGMFVNLGSASLGALNVTSVAGSITGATIISVAGASNLFGVGGTLAAGLEMYYSAGNSAAVSLTYGAALPAGATWVQAFTTPFDLSSQTAGKYVTVALVNKQTGHVVAGGSAVEVVGA